MNFRQIEVIFLIAFISLNLFLFKIYQQGVLEATKLEAANTTSESIEKRLNKDGIKVESKQNFSKKIGEGAYISGEATALTSIASTYSRSNGEDRIYVNLPNMTTGTVDMKEPQNLLKKLVELGQDISFDAEYVYNEETSQSPDQMVYTQKWNDIVFMDETAQLSMTMEKVGDNLVSYHYDQSHIENIEYLREKQKMCSEEDAIVTLYNNSKIPSDSTIKWTKLYYTRIFKVKDKNVYIPAWFVGIQTSKNVTQVERVNALTKNVLSTNILEVQNN